MTATPAMALETPRPRPADMWLAVAAFLGLALAITAAVLVRRNAEHLDLVRRALRTAGDDHVPPTSVRQGLRRLAALPPAASEAEEGTMARLRAALDETPTGAVVTDADGVVVYRNRAAQPYASGRHGDALTEASIRARIAESLLGKDSDEDIRLHGPPERVLHVVGSPLVVDGELIGAVVLIDDTSEQHRAAAVRRDFVANVSHELRTPVGALSLLAETIEGETDPEVVSRFLSRIRGESTRLTRLIDDLLDLSRIEGGVPEHGDPVDISTIIRDAAGAIREAADHKGIMVDLEIENSPAVVSGDHAQLVSAVTNLLENAVKYTEPGGVVTCRVATHGGETAIAVVDTGVGIPQRDLNRVFERFYRVDRGRSSESGGTGLGLAIVRHVAVNHGGRVEVVSQEGVGSTFTIVLPNEERVTEREAV